MAAYEYFMSGPNCGTHFTGNEKLVSQVSQMLGSVHEVRIAEVFRGNNMRIFDKKITRTTVLANLSCRLLTAEIPGEP